MVTKIYYKINDMKKHIEVNIKYPNNIISMGFQYYLDLLEHNGIINGNTPLYFYKDALKDFYNILRTHSFKEDFPDGYRERLISKIQEKCRIHWKNEKAQWFKFEDDKIQTYRLPKGFNSVSKDLLELLVTDGWDKFFANEAIGYALKNCENQENAVELHQLAYFYKDNIAR